MPETAKRAEWTIYTSAGGRRSWVGPDVDGDKKVVPAADAEQLEAELNEERALGFKKEDREMLLAEIEQLEERVKAAQLQDGRHIAAARELTSQKRKAETRAEQLAEALREILCNSAEFAARDVARQALARYEGTSDEG